MVAKLRLQGGQIK